MTKYEVIAKHPNSDTEWITYESKSLDSCKKEYHRLKTNYPHLKLKIIKVTEERVRI